MKVTVCQCPCRTPLPRSVRPWGTAMRVRHVGSHAGFVQQHQFRNIKRRLVCLPLPPCALHVCAFLLADVQSFLNLRPHLWS
jgi:hypothetical protein